MALMLVSWRGMAGHIAGCGPPCGYWNEGTVLLSFNNSNSSDGIGRELIVYSLDQPVSLRPSFNAQGSLGPSLKNLSFSIKAAVST